MSRWTRLCIELSLVLDNFMNRLRNISWLMLVSVRLADWILAMAEPKRSGLALARLFPGRFRTFNVEVL